MLKKYKTFLIFSSVLLAGCPMDPVVNPTPTPSISVPTSGPVSTPTPQISITPIDTFTNITGTDFKIDFGPGTKGVSNLGPGSKGVNNLGPGTKGVSNLKVNVNFDPNLIRSDLSGFTTKAESNLFVDDVLLTLESDGEKIADINVIPKSQQVQFTIDTNIKPGLYDLKAVVKNNFEPLNVISKVQLESNLELKVVLYAKTLNRKDLDISIRTKPIKEQQ